MSLSSAKPQRSNGNIPLALLLPALIAGRVLVALTLAPDSLKYDHQLSSPLTAYLHLQEGIFLYRRGIDPYDGGVFRHSPLYLAMFTTVLPNSRMFAPLLWALFDGVGAWAIMQIWRARQRLTESSRDSLIVSLYLLNPYLFLPNLALSTASLDNTLVLLSFMFASQGRVSASLLALSFVAQLSPSSTLLLAPLLLLNISTPVSRLASPAFFQSSLRKTVPLFAEFITYSGILTLAAALVAGGWTWGPQAWGAVFTLPDLTPNPGMWWYFFTEIFDHFRPFFLVVFSVHLIIYVAPICLKFQHDMLYAAFLLIGILGTFKSYPTLADPGLFLSMSTLFPEVFPYLRHPIVTALLHVHAALLLPLFHHLWLSQGTGNANFFYASTLVFACANGAALIDFMWAGLRIALGEERNNIAVVQE